MKITFKSVDDLIPYAMNSRTHSEEQVLQIASSIKEFGFNNPVLIDSSGGIIAGHGRVLAARKIGICEVPVIELSHLTETQKKAYVIADNKIALNAGWDEEMLKLELEELRLAEFDIDITGFTDQEFDLLANNDSNSHDGQIIADDYSGNCEARVMVGDVWAMGGHRLMCGDSSRIDHVELLLSGVTPDVLIYDPPYENEDSWNYFYPCGKAIVFCDFKYLQRAMKICSLFETNYQFIWDNCTSWYTPNRPLARHKTAIFCSNDKKWNFSAAIYRDGKERKSKTVSNTRGECDYEPLEDGFVHLQTVYQEPNVGQDSAHAHSKPIKWINAIMRGTDGKVFLDLFAGSGATIIAAPEFSSVYAMEIEQSNCDRIISRWEEATGLTAVKL